jgi:hypothetical protein
VPLGTHSGGVPDSQQHMVGPHPPLTQGPMRPDEPLPVVLDALLPTETPLDELLLNTQNPFMHVALTPQATPLGSSWYVQIVPVQVPGVF